MTSKKEWVLKAFKGEPVEKVPVGFWHHFTTSGEWVQGLDNPSIFQKNLDGHIAYIHDVKPDFVKIMSDGFFHYPNDQLVAGLTDITKLSDIKPLGENHPWIEQQVALVKAIRSEFPEEVASFYNIFSPATYFKWQVAGQVAIGDDLLVDFIEKQPQVTKHVLDTIAADVATLIKRVIVEAGADGIYLSVQNLQDERATKENYRAIIKPSEVQLLEAAREVGGTNILHICGYEGATNDVTYYTDYPADVFNWAVGPEKISLSEGKRLFEGKTVLGGFDNTVDGLLYKGSEEAIKNHVKQLLADAGTQGVVIGADCTIPSDTPVEHIQWVKEAIVK